PDRATRVEQHVLIRAMRIGVITQFCDLSLAGERCIIEGFDVRQIDIEVESLEIDTTIHDRVEHEAIVRARRKTERQLHISSRMARTHRPRFSIPPLLLPVSPLRPPP